MPFIRHELGARLRIRRIPELHVRLDDSAERGTRVLHLLTELEAGAEPDEIAADQRVAAHARPAAAPRGRRRARRRVRQPRAPVQEAGPPSVEPSRARREPGRPGCAAQGARAARRGAARDDHGPVHRPVGVGAGRRPGRRPRAARAAPATSSPSATRTRTRTRSARCSGVCHLVEALGGRATAGVHRSRARRSTAFLPGIERFRTDPEPGAAYDLLVLARLRDRGAGGRRRPPARGPVRDLPRLTIDHHASNDGAGEADWIDPDAAATCEMVALLAVCLGQPLDLAGGRASRTP